MPSDRTCILAFDTSAAHCAAALLSGGQCRARRSEAMARGQAERLVPMLENVLAEAGLGWRDLTGLGVGIGPGNFTGLRLGVAAARGIAMALGVRAVGVSAFEALAARSGLAGPVLVLLKNPRGADYAQAYCNDPSAAPVALCPAEAGLDHLPDLPADTVCIGYEASRIAGSLGLKAGMSETQPDAESIAMVAATRISLGSAAPAPLYLRAADAAPARERPPILLDDA